MKLLRAFSLILLLPLALTAGQAGNQEKCPVMGGKIDRELYADHEGQRVYFCCRGCEKKFAADPAGYIARMKAAGVTPAEAPKAQTECPVMGGKIDRKYFADHEGRRIYFCCPDCKTEFRAEPRKYLDKLKAQGIEAERAPAQSAPADQQHQH